jgi:DNA-binding beta-propeller fold protein YncE
VAARKVLGYILAGKRACGITLSRDEKTLYVANNGLGDDVSIIDTASRKAKSRYQSVEFPTALSSMTEAGADRERGETMTGRRRGARFM